MFYNRALFFISVLFLTSCNPEGQVFVELDPAKSGIDFFNAVKDNEKVNILDYLYFYNGGGVAAGDINNDGLEDLYFVSNLGPNKLYLNKGNLEFEDISKKAKIEGVSTWNTGATMVDINNDGWLDIYVCAVVGIHGFMGQNELYINQKDGTFKEQASAYGLAIQNYSTSTAFFDYDKDGDLDMYLLNHGIHKTSNFFGVDRRDSFSEMSSDKFFKNDDGFFIDVTKEANLFGGEVGYGLAVGIHDLNADGWDDIYVSNDFYEDDYLYINQKDGTFTEMSHESLSQTSQFSMGNDISDINHDGLADIITLDMLPEDEKILKNSLGEINYNSLISRRSLGYNDQFPRNHLQINTGKGKFLEIGLLANISATDWSWAPVFADFDNDGQKDLVISNGIYRRPNDADYIKYVSSEQIRNKINNTRLVDNMALEKMPRGDVKNYFFKGNEDLRFKDVSSTWIRQKAGLSNGLVTADLDNDGDLDLVFNNINATSTVLENKGNANNALKIKFVGNTKNRFGIGTKVYAYVNGKVFYEQLHPTRGFLSSFPHNIHIGIGESEVDSITVIWPDNKEERLYDMKNQNLLVFDYNNAIQPATKEFRLKNDLFVEQNIAQIDHINTEKSFPEFNREKLMPYGVTQEGTPIAIGDVNNDGKDDMFFGGTKGYTSVLYISSSDNSYLKTTHAFENEKKHEDTDAIFTDIDNDDDLDLFVVSGGGEFQGKSNYNKDRVYINDGNGNFSLSQSILPEYFHNGSVVVSSDFDGDGDQDYFVGSRSTTKSFGKAPESFLLINENSKLSIASDHPITQVGMVTDAILFDFDNDADKDLIIVSEWSEVKIFENDKGNLVDSTKKLFSDTPKGLWQSIELFDIDQDGIKEIIVGNVGLNTKFSASKSYPLKMYVNDFDSNGQTESIVAIAKNGDYYTIDSKDKMQGQMPELIRKKFSTYADFAGKTIEEIFGTSLLSRADQYIVDELQNGYFKLSGNRFTFNPLPTEFQWGPITKIKPLTIKNIDHLILTGSKSDLPPYQGLWQSQKHFLLRSSEEFEMLHLLGIDLIHQDLNDLETVKIDGKNLLILGIVNQKTKFFNF